MINLEKGQSAPLIKIEPTVNDEARQEIASEGVNIVDVEDVVPMPTKIEVKKAPLKKKKALGKRASRKKKIVNGKKNVNAKKAENIKNGVVKVKPAKVVAVKEVIIPEKRKVGRPRLTDKQKAVRVIIKDGKKLGKVITVYQAGVIYDKIKQSENIKSVHGARIWMKSVRKMPNDVCKKMIILMAVTAIIKGKLGMPKNINAYKDRSIEMAAVQTANLSGYFTTAFAGLALWITRNGLLATAITNYGKKDGSGSTALIRAAKLDVRSSLNLFMAYINSLAFANQALAVSIIETALCVVIVKKAKTVIDFQYKMGPGTGNIRLISATVKDGLKTVQGTYEFQYGVMVEGVIVWVSLPSQKNCKITLTGMSTTVTTFFRKRSSTTKGGMSAWCAPISTTVA